MKRMWIGIFLLLIIGATGIVMLFFSAYFYRHFSETLTDAKTFALAENWEDASQKAQEADALWQRYRRFLSASTDHEPVEEIELLLSRLRLYEKQRMTVDFADICQSLCHLCEAIDESHNLKWWSIL